MAKRKTTKKAAQNNKLNTQSWWADGDLDPRLPNLEGNAGKIPVVAENEKGFEYGNIATAFAHSFDDLDPTLKALCETAIGSRKPQPCTQEQWNTIKALLDKSLYFYYDGYTMIKTGGGYPEIYSFSCISVNSGFALEFSYDLNELTIYSHEV